LGLDGERLRLSGWNAEGSGLTYDPSDFPTFYEQALKTENYIYFIKMVG